MSGINHYADKQKRLERRRNHIARDLRTPKYAPRVIEDKRRKIKPQDDDYEWPI